MNNKTLGVIAMLTAPFLCIDFFTASSATSVTWQSGLFGLIYMTGWMCSVYALDRAGILGTKKFSRIIIAVQLVLLTLAQCWNVWVIIEPISNHIIYRILDMCWPLSNLCMLIIGITILVSKQITGWKRFIPLFVGLWLPSLIVTSITAGQHTPYIAGPYSAIAFCLLGYVVFTLPANSKNETVEYKVQLV
jgi:hypothetical protein